MLGMGKVSDDAESVDRDYNMFIANPVASGCEGN